VGKQTIYYVRHTIYEIMFEYFLNNKDSWLNGKGPEAEIVFSSRIRLARNIANLPFPSQANNAQEIKVLDKAKGSFNPKINSLKSSSFVNMAELSSLDSQFFSRTSSNKSGTCC